MYISKRLAYVSTYLWREVVRICLALIELIEAHRWESNQEESVSKHRADVFRRRVSRLPLAFFLCPRYGPLVDQRLRRVEVSLEHL